jgi:hypothetical protein
VAYQRDVFELSKVENNLRPATPGWLPIKPAEPLPTRSCRSPALLAGLFGLVLGTASALLADRRAKRVYRSRQLLQLLAYPLWAKLPPRRWHWAGGC